MFESTGWKSKCGWQVGTVWLVVCSIVSAADFRPAPGKWVGTYTGVVQLTVAADGKITYELPGLITITGGGGVVVPPPVDPPPPGNQTPFERAVAKLTSEAIAAGGTATTAAGISSVYSLVGEAVGKGEISPDNTLTAVNAGVRMVMVRQPDRDKWSEFRLTVGDSLDTLRQDKLLVTKEQYSGVCREIANGMNSVTGFNGNAVAPAQDAGPNAGLFGNIDITKIIEWIKALIELFKTFTK